MELTITDPDANTLRNLLNDYLTDLSLKGARTKPDARDLRAEFARREVLCERLIRELGPSAAAGHPTTGCSGQSCRSVAGLSPAEVATYRHRLREAAARLVGQVTALVDEARQPTDSALGTTEEAAAVVLLHAEEGALAEVNAALDRIDRGTYGRCEACGKPVAKTRLDALPQASHCIACARTIVAG